MERFLNNSLDQPTVRKHLSLLVLGSILGISFYTFLSFNETFHSLEMYLSGFLGVLIGYCLLYSSIWLDKKLLWYNQPGLRLFAGVLINLLIALPILCAALYGYYSMGTHEYALWNHPDQLIKMAILLLCAILLFNIIYFAFYSYNHYMRGQLAAYKIERKQAQLQLNMLKSQLSPHFLFNSINSLTELLKKDVSKAESFIRALAKTYDYILESYNSTLVTLTEELELLDSYFFVLSTRFGNGFQLQRNLDESYGLTKMPPLTLQILAENAVKHNIIDNKSPIVLSIYERNGKLVVTNNRRPRTQRDLDSTKIGLKNIQSRYQLLVDKQIEIEEGSNFTVRLPIIQ